MMLLFRKLIYILISTSIEEPSMKCERMHERTFKVIRKQWSRSIISMTNFNFPIAKWICCHLPAFASLAASSTWSLGKSRLSHIDAQVSLMTLLQALLNLNTSTSPRKCKRKLLPYRGTLSLSYTTICFNDDFAQSALQPRSVRA